MTETNAAITAAHSARITASLSKFDTIGENQRGTGRDREDQQHRQEQPTRPAAAAPIPGAAGQNGHGLTVPARGPCACRRQLRRFAVEDYSGERSARRPVGSPGDLQQCLQPQRGDHQRQARSRRPQPRPGCPLPATAQPRRSQSRHSTPLHQPSISAPTQAEALAITTLRATATGAAGRRRHRSARRGSWPAHDTAQAASADRDREQRQPGPQRDRRETTGTGHASAARPAPRRRPPRPSGRAYGSAPSAVGLRVVRGGCPSPAPGRSSGRHPVDRLELGQQPVDAAASHRPR